MPHPKLRSFYTPPVDYIAVLPDITVDCGLLLAEFNEHCSSHMQDAVNRNPLIQKKFHLMLNLRFHELIHSMPYTQQIVHTLSSILPYNSINYRSIQPNTAYNWHQDKGQCCLHIPLITNRGCWFVYENHSFSMPANGSVYIVNNHRYHTFVNSGATPRLHITFEIL